MDHGQLASMMRSKQREQASKKESRQPNLTHENAYSLYTQMYRSFTDLILTMPNACCI